MPTGLYSIRSKENGFKAMFVTPRIHESLLWIGWMRATKLKNVAKLRTLLNEGEVCSNCICQKKKSKKV